MAIAKSDHGMAAAATAERRPVPEAAKSLGVAACVAIVVGNKLHHRERISALPLSAVSEIITGCSDPATLQPLRKQSAKLIQVAR